MIVACSLKFHGGQKTDYSAPSSTDTNVKSGFNMMTYSSRSSLCSHDMPSNLLGVREWPSVNYNPQIVIAQSFRTFIHMTSG